METGVYLKFREFTDKGAAVGLVAMLSDNYIHAEIEVLAASFDPGFSRSEMNVEYCVKLLKEDFTKAEAILKKQAAEDLKGVEKNHYLFQFSDEELRDVLAKEDEWSEYDVLLAQKILNERGKPVPENMLRDMKAARMKELAKAEKSPNRLITAGHLLWPIPMLNFISIMTGWHLYSQKKTLPNGDRLYSYTAADRKHGKRILILGIISLAAWMLLLMFMTFVVPFIGHNYY